MHIYSIHIRCIRKLPNWDKLSPKVVSSIHTATRALFRSVDWKYWSRERTAEWIFDDYFHVSLYFALFLILRLTDSTVIEIRKYSKQWGMSLTSFLLPPWWWAECLYHLRHLHRDCWYVTLLSILYTDVLLFAISLFDVTFIRLRNYCLSIMMSEKILHKRKRERREIILKNWCRWQLI